VGSWSNVAIIDSEASPSVLKMTTHAVSVVPPFANRDTPIKAARKFRFASHHDIVLTNMCPPSVSIFMSPFTWHRYGLGHVLDHKKADKSIHQFM
jgi:hypothetical protein